MDIPMTSAFSDAVPRNQALSLATLAKLGRRYLWLIVLLAIAGGIAGYAYATTQPKIYTSSSTVAVEGDRSAIPQLQGALLGANAPDPMPGVRTEVQALSSRQLVQGVIGQLHLDQDPEFNPALQPPSWSQILKDRIKAFFPQGAGAPTSDAPDEAVLIAVEHALVVTHDDRSLVINVSFTARDPKLAANFVNTLVHDYVASRADRRTAADKSANTVLSDRIDHVRADLAGLEQQMRDLRSKSDLVGLRAGSVGQQELEELATAAANASIQTAQLEATWQRASALVKSGSSDELASVLGSSTISHLRDQESQASSRVADLSSRYGASYPGLRSARADLDATNRQLGAETQRIVASLRAQLDVARAHQADVQQQLNRARVAAVKTQDAQAQLQQLQDEVTSQRKVYQSLLDQAQQTVSQPTAVQTPDVRVLSTAVPSAMPSGPNMKLASGFGMVGGGILACILALARISSVDGFATPAELTEITGMPVLATVQRLSGRYSLSDRVSASPAGPDAEMMRLLRVRLRAACRPHAARSVMFTATTTGADAAGVAAAFARVAAADGERVLLVEGDLRHPALAQLLGSPSGELVAVLEGRAEWRDVLASDQQIPLDLLLGGEQPRDAHALVSGTNLQNLLVEARDDYSLIVLTSPAAGEADALALGQRADAAVLVVSGRRARRVATRAAVERLGPMSRNPVTAVLVTAA